MVYFNNSPRIVGVPSIEEIEGIIRARIAAVVLPYSGKVLDEEDIYCKIASQRARIDHFKDRLPGKYTHSGMKQWRPHERSISIQSQLSAACKQMALLKRAAASFCEMYLEIEYSDDGNEELAAPEIDIVRFRV